MAFATRAASSELDDILDSLKSLQLDITTSLNQPSKSQTSHAGGIRQYAGQAAELEKQTGKADIVRDDDDEFPLPPPPEELLWPPMSPASLRHQESLTNDHLDSRGADSCEVMSTDSGIQESPPMSARRKKLTSIDDVTLLTPVKEMPQYSQVEESSKTQKEDLQCKTASEISSKHVSVTNPYQDSVDGSMTRKEMKGTEIEFNTCSVHERDDNTDGSRSDQTVKSELNISLQPQNEDNVEPHGLESTIKPDNDNSQTNIEANSRHETKEERKNREKAEKRASKDRDRIEKIRKKEEKRNRKLSSSSRTSKDQSQPVITAKSSVGQSVTNHPDAGATSEDQPSLLSVSFPGDNKESKNVNNQEKQKDFCSSTIQERIEIMNEIFSKDYLKKIAVRIHNIDKTTKMLLVDERMKAGHTCNLMANKNLTERQLNHAIVEKLPEMKMERIIEDHELLADTLLAWPDNSKNLLFFEERSDKFGVITNPSEYLSGIYAAEDGETPEQNQVRIINDLFDGQGSVPTLKEFLYVRMAGSKSWKKMMCTIRSSGIYTMKEKKGTTQDLICLTPLADFLVYKTLGGWTKTKKIDSPTPYGFALKHLQTQSLSSKQIYFFAALSEKSMKIWHSVIRLAMNSNQYYLNYQQAHGTANRS